MELTVSELSPDDPRTDCARTAVATRCRKQGCCSPQGILQSKRFNAASVVSCDLRPVLHPLPMQKPFLGHRAEGVVKFVGLVPEIGTGLFIGLELTEGIGVHDGLGYFTCR